MYFKIIKINKFKIAQSVYISGYSCVCITVNITMFLLGYEVKIKNLTILKKIEVLIFHIL